MITITGFTITLKPRVCLSIKLTKGNRKVNVKYSTMLFIAGNLQRILLNT